MLIRAPANSRETGHSAEASSTASWNPSPSRPLTWPFTDSWDEMIVGPRRPRRG
jgi:hypothetical protein